MMGLSGIIHQMIITKQGTIEQLMNFKSVDPAAFKGLAGLSTAPVLAGGAASCNGAQGSGCRWPLTAWLAGGCAAFLMAR